MIFPAAQGGLCDVCRNEGRRRTERLGGRGARLGVGRDAERAGRAGVTVAALFKFLYASQHSNLEI